MKTRPIVQMIGRAFSPYGLSPLIPGALRIERAVGAVEDHKKAGRNACRTFVRRAAAQGGAGIPACPKHSAHVERPLAFDAVELFSFLVDGLFDYFEAVGGGSACETRSFHP